MATEQHTRPNASNATPGLVGVSFLLAIALATYTIRMYTRIRPKFRLAASDYFVTSGLVSQLPYSSFCNRSKTRCTGLRTGHVVSSAGHHRPRRVRLRRIHFTNSPDQDRETLLCPRPHGILGFIPGADINWMHAPPFPHIEGLENDALDPTRHPGSHAHRRQHLRLTAVPARPRHVGARTDGSVLA